MAAIIRQLVRLLIATVVTVRPAAPEPTPASAGAQPCATARVSPARSLVDRIVLPIFGEATRAS
jgi:hypothetical protein